MKVVLLALVVGLAVGALFGGVRLPIPAPPTLAGVAGVVGVYLGYLLITHALHR